MLPDRSSIALAVMLLFSSSPNAIGQAFTPGNLAVLELTIGAFHGGPYAIREYTPTGTLVNTYSVPETGPNAIVGKFSAGVESQLTRTPGGDALLFAGFSQPASVGTNIGTTSAATNPRVIGRLDANGNFTIAASTNTDLSGETIHGVATDDAGHIWAGSTTGIRYMDPAGPVNILATGTRALHHQNGQLYSCSVNNDVLTVGTGSPTVPASSAALFNSSNVLDVQFSPDGNTAYVVQGFSQVKKWVWNGSAWTNPYDLVCAPSSWLVRIAVDFSGPSPIVYGVHNVPTKLVRWVDLGPGSPEEFLASSTGFFYGVAMAPACAIGELCDDGDPLTHHDLTTSGCTCRGTSTNLSPRVLLSGAMPTPAPTMRDSLRSLPDFPQTEPYTDLGLPPVNTGALIDQAVLSRTGPAAIVDWILVELRALSDPSSVVARVSALLQRDGYVVDASGIGPVRFPVDPGPYHVAVRHRNHLGAMTQNTYELGMDTTLLDLRFPALPLHGTNAMRSLGALRALWSGDVTGDGTVKYAGVDNDRDAILQRIGGNVPTAVVTGYHASDLNLDGMTKYAGAENDRDIILGTVGGSVPTAIRTEQVP
ncbi:MAG: hypothetical protein KDB88_02195 [Flavobacteriales bacterium]|nr:hypothetical protein [Flavobacteriales bacterium]